MLHVIRARLLFQWKPDSLSGKSNRNVMQAEEAAGKASFSEIDSIATLEFVLVS